MKKIKESVVSNKKIIAVVIVLIFLILGSVLIFVKENDYVVKFNSDGGTIVVEQKITKGKNPMIPEDPTRENYVFLGWLCNGEPFDFSIPLEGDVVLTAKWVEIDGSKSNYIVKFDSLDGTTILNQVIEDGKVVTKPKDPVKSGYKFMGWMLNDFLYDFSNPVKSDMVLVANFIATNEKNDGSLNSTIKTPTLFYPQDMGTYPENGVYLIDFGVKLNDYCLENCEKMSVDGFELYEVNNGKYSLLGSNEVGGAVPVEISSGSKKTFVARVFVNEKEGQKKYSDYSNQIVIDKTALNIPTIYYPQDMGLYPENGKYLIDFGVNIKEYCVDSNCNKMKVDGFELYEKTGSNYKLIGSNEVGGAVPVEIALGEKKILSARVFIKDSKGEKTYSGYSKEVLINKSKIATPTLFYMKDMVKPDKDGNYIIDFGVYSKNYCIDKDCKQLFVNGFELYEKTGSNYKLIGSNEVGGAVVLETSVGTKKGYVARVFITDKNGKKIYSGYSKEVVIDLTTFATPTVFYMEDMVTPDEKGNYVIDFGVKSTPYVVGNIGDNLSVHGFELYEKTGSNYKLIGSNEVGGAVVLKTSVGTKKSYVARVFVKNSKGEKTYSGYSKEVILDLTTFATPTVFYMEDMVTPDENGNYVIDFGIKSTPYVVGNVGDNLSVHGFELYEKTGSNYKLIGSNEVGGAVVLETSVGTKKSYVARVFVKNSKGEKTYSGYSKEVILDLTTFATPTVFYMEDMVTPDENGNYVIDFGIKSTPYVVGNVGNNLSVHGFELYEKTGSNYKLIGSNEVGGAVVLETSVGTKKSYVARVFVKNSKGEKTYSGYSKEVILDLTTFATPTVFYMEDMVIPDENGNYVIDFGIKSTPYVVGNVGNNLSVHGFELYEKTGSNYKLIGSNEVGGAVVLETVAGTKKSYVARVFVKNSKGEKTYSGYSKEVILDLTK